MLPSETMQEKIEWLKTPKGQESIKEYFLGLEKQKQDIIDYVGSDEFNKTYEIIYNFVKNPKHGTGNKISNIYNILDDTDIHYRLNNGRIDLETEEWNKFTDAIAEKFKGQEIIDKSSDFIKYHFEYRSLNVYFTHGQGTVCWVTYNKENDREIKLDNLLGQCENS